MSANITTALRLVRAFGMFHSSTNDRTRKHLLSTGLVFWMDGTTRVAITREGSEYLDKAAKIEARREARLCGDANSRFSRHHY